MPSVQSLALQQYYGNPQNSFWWIMSRICGFDPNIDYSEKATAVGDAGFAIWDVLHDCERPGSADSNIVPGTERINDFARFFAEHNRVGLIAFNGAAAEKLFLRHCGELIQSSSDTRTVRLPSTSPAYAAMPKVDKLKNWQAVLEPQLR